MSVGRSQNFYAVPVGWMMYALALLIVFLVLTFPYDALHAMFLVRLSERTGVEFSAQGWDVRPPAALVWIRPSILVPGLDRIESEQIQINVNVGSLLRGQPVLLWSGRVGGGGESNGHLKGELSMGSLPWKSPMQILASLDRLDLSHLNLPLVKKGFLRGRLERRWADLAEADQCCLDEWTWHVELTDLVLEQVPVGPHFLSLTLSSLNGRLACHAGTCRLDSVTGESQDGMFSGEGRLVLRDPFSMSHLTVTLSVIMTEALRERLHLMSLGPMTPGLPQKLTLSGSLSDLQVSL